MKRASQHTQGGRQRNPREMADTQNVDYSHILRSPPDIKETYANGFEYIYIYIHNTVITEDVKHCLLSWSEIIYTFISEKEQISIQIGTHLLEMVYFPMWLRQVILPDTVVG